MSNEKKAVLRVACKAAFPHTIPVLTGYIFLGMAFGILLNSKGYSAWWALLMSGLIYAGSMQFVAIELLASIFNPIQTVIMSLVVNARHLFYGISMLDKFKDIGKKKGYMIFGLTDETFSLLCGAKTPEGVDENWFRFFITLLDQTYWVLGSVMGGVIGSMFKFNTTGIDFVMTALFIVIYLDQWKSTKDHFPAIAGVVVTVLCLIVFKADNFLIPSMIGILIVLALYKKIYDGKGEKR
ncbi:AzlC family ABC transporter permease [Diplocloster agilis]|uniref:AzlC family ABC transporter permease n=1 Tax=Diplocloster agilis TaxID=2850323 RepID=A0A949NBB4_9FIRM|nr:MULTISPECIES: AzlC family ABC transporter permease [Lachnospiraceae]MBU9737402.1 AzlC family ABC transporter permease [Diplocloster agilis]MBU9745578.1 AzlC family ABC transporter permease [Diplocloster agilis]MCU6735127.1 AzlC family ABC transporter permease [Suonthocola fibrivorans]SCJ64827.1 Inner membrane protein YgaZ [uncultured Clostridium sp.]